MKRLKEDIINYAKSNGFEVKVINMPPAIIAKVIADDNIFVAGSNLHRLIVINNLYIDKYEIDGDLFNNIIKSFITDFLDSNEDGTYMRSIENEDYENFLELYEEVGECDIDNSSIVNVFRDNVNIEIENELDVYLDTLKKAEYYTKKVDAAVLLMREKAISDDEIKSFLSNYCKKELIDAFDNRQNLISKNRERSNYLKKKYRYNNK